MIGSTQAANFLAADAYVLPAETLPNHSEDASQPQNNNLEIIFGISHEGSKEVRGKQARPSVLNDDDDDAAAAAASKQIASVPLFKLYRLHL